MSQVVATLQKKQAPQYKFSYQPEALEKVKLAEVRLKAASLTSALQQLQKQYGLHYLLDGSTVSFKYVPLSDQPAVPKKDPGKVNGKIVDEEIGQPVVEATIRIGNTGAITDVDGSLRFPCPKAVILLRLVIWGMPQRKSAKL
ncbi:MAG: hypothetical protein WDO16_24305 [Bacteroidota bacterium]